MRRGLIIHQSPPARWVKPSAQHKTQLTKKTPKVTPREPRPTTEQPHHPHRKRKRTLKPIPTSQKSDKQLPHSWLAETNPQAHKHPQHSQCKHPQANPGTLVPTPNAPKDITISALPSTPNPAHQQEDQNEGTAAEDFHPRVTVDQAEGSATESLYILVGLTLKLGYCITVFEFGWNTGLWFLLVRVGSLKGLFYHQCGRKISFFLEKWVQDNYFRKELLQLAISNGELCLGETEVSKDVCAENKPKSPRKCTSFRETTGTWLRLSYQLPQKLLWWQTC